MNRIKCNVENAILLALHVPVSMIISAFRVIHRSLIDNKIMENASAFPPSKISNNRYARNVIILVMNAFKFLMQIHVALVHKTLTEKIL